MSASNNYRNRSINHSHSQSDDQSNNRRNRSNYPVINSVFQQSLLCEESDYQTANNQQLHQRGNRTEALQSSDSGSSNLSESSNQSTESAQSSNPYFDHSSDQSLDEAIVIHCDENDEEYEEDSDCAVEQSDWSDSLFDCLIDGPVCCCAMLFPCLRWSLSITRWFNQSVQQSLKQQKFDTDEPLKQRIMPSTNFKIALVFVLSMSIYGLLYGGTISLYVYLNTAFPQTFTEDGIAVYDTVYIIFLCVLVTVWVMLACVAGYFRGKMRRYWGIGGNCGEDFLVHAVCGCCAVAQEARHVDREAGIIV